MKKFRGTYTVLITPFTADGKKVDEAALRRLVDFQIAEGIHGLIPLGSTGEFLSVTPDERRQIVDIVVTQAARRVPVLIGTGAEWTDEVVRSSLASNVLTYGTILFLLIGIPFAYFVLSTGIFPTVYSSYGSPVYTRPWFFYLSGILLSSHPIIAMVLSETLLLCTIERKPSRESMVQTL